MFKNKSIMKQKGFTLLELLVVITLLAILAVGGLVAYDGVGENAEASAGAYNISSLDRAVRQYRAVTNTYPDQWDNLANPTTGLAAGGSNFLAPETQSAFGAWNIAGASAGFQTAIVDRIEGVWGMEEVQHITAPVDVALVSPGKAHNEGSNPGALETEFGDIGTAAGEYAWLSIVPSHNGTACTAGGVPVTTALNGNTVDATANLRLNAMNDAMGTSRCHLVIALGFGGDAAASTSRGSVSIPAAATYTSPRINPAVNYGRYIGLFHMGRTEGATAITEAELFARPRLIGFVTPEGTTVDQLVQGTRSPDQE